MPNYDQLQLSNIALNMAGGRSQITNLAESSNEARNCNLIFTKVTREVLARFSWDFATTSAELAPVTNGGLIPSNWLGAWVRPDDALRLLFVRDGNAGASGIPIFPGGLGQMNGRGGASPFAVGNVGGIRCVFANTRRPILTYVAWVPDFNLWSDDAIELLTTKLAARLAIPIANDKGLFDRLSQEVRVLEARFEAANANEGTDIQDTPTDWMLQRDAIDFPFVGRPQSVVGDLFDLPATPPTSGAGLWNDGGLLAYAGPTAASPAPGSNDVHVILDGGAEG